MFYCPADRVSTHGEVDGESVTYLNLTSVNAVRVVDYGATAKLFYRQFPKSGLSNVPGYQEMRATGHNFLCWLATMKVINNVPAELTIAACQEFPGAGSRARGT